MSLCYILASTVLIENGCIRFTVFATDVLFLVLESWELSGISLCLLHGSDSSQPFYVDISLVGRPENGGEGVQCRTDLSTCCTGTQGGHRGDGISLMELDCHSLVVVI